MSNASSFSSEYLTCVRTPELSPVSRSFHVYMPGWDREKVAVGGLGLALSGKASRERNEVKRQLVLFLMFGVRPFRQA